MNKNSFYQMFDDKFNKDKIYQEVLEKHDKKKRNVIKCCFVPAVFLLGVVIFFATKDLFYEEDQNILEDKEDQIYVNEIVSEDDLSDDISNLDVKILNTDSSSFSVTPLEVQVPSDLELDSIYFVYVKDQKSGEYTIIHDTIETYKGDDRALNIAYSSLGKVLRDVDVPVGRMSVIQDTNVMISSMDESFIIEFQYDGVNYDIESYHLTLDEVLMVVRSIIN